MADQSSKPIYVIAGKDMALVGRACDELLEDLISPSQRQMALLSLDGKEAQLAQVLDELRTLPFLCDRRIVLVKNAEDFISKNRPALERYFDKPCHSSILIFTVGSFAANTKLAKKLKTAGKLIAVQPPKPYMLGKMAVAYANKKCGKSLDQKSADFLVELVGDNLSGIYNEIDKLAIYTDDKNTISFDDIKQLTASGRGFSVFEVLDSIGSKDKTVAISRLRSMLALDRSSQFTAIGAFAMHLRKMFNAKVMLNAGQNQMQVAAKARIWSAKQQFFDNLEKLSLQAIACYIAAIAETDYMIKTGQATPSAALEQFVMRLVRP